MGSGMLHVFLCIFGQSATQAKPSEPNHSILFKISVSHAWVCLSKLSPMGKAQKSIKCKILVHLLWDPAESFGWMRQLKTEEKQFNLHTFIYCLLLPIMFLSFFLYNKQKWCYNNIKRDNVTYKLNANLFVFFSKLLPSF